MVVGVVGTTIPVGAGALASHPPPEAVPGSKIALFPIFGSPHESGTGNFTPLVVQPVSVNMWTSPGLQAAPSGGSQVHFTQSRVSSDPV
jgi:hypothetical protein